VIMTTPISVSACARAVTKEEAAYRIDYPLAYARSTRVVAFDETAEKTVRSVSDGPWGQAQFYTTSDSGEELITLDGQRRPMVMEIEHSDSVIMVATNSIVSTAAASVGAACRERSIMTAGLLLLDAGALGGDALSALRPYARILLVPADEEDLFELLKAIRA
jgi:hypothetical protein